VYGCPGKDKSIMFRTSYFIYFKGVPQQITMNHRPWDARPTKHCVFSWRFDSHRMAYHAL